MRDGLAPPGSPRSPWGTTSRPMPSPGMTAMRAGFKAGMLPAQAAIRVVGALWVSTDGCAVRLREAQSWIDGGYRERWTVSEPDSGSYSPSKPITLVGCRLVWHPVWGTNIPAAVRQAADRTQGKANR